MERNKERVYFNGVMEKFMMDNGKEEKRMEVVCGRDKMGNRILDNGKMVKFKVLEFLSCKMVQDTRANSKIHWNMDWVQRDSIMVKLTLEVIKKTDQTDKANIIGPTATITKDNFQTD